MNDNRVTLNISPTDEADIIAAIQTLQTKLLPYLITLTPSERQALPKMGDKTLAFVTKAAEFMAQNPNLVPSYVDVAELDVDLKAVAQLRGFHNQLFEFTKGLEDTMMQSGSEAYLAALSFYRAVKAAARVPVPNAENVYNELRVRFPGRN